MVQGILAFMICNPNFTFLTRCQYTNIVGIRLFLISGYRLLPESDKSHKLFPEKWLTQSSRRVFCLFVCLICLHQGLVAARGIFVASCRIFHCGALILQLWCKGSIVVACRLSCPVTRGILVPTPRTKPVSPELQGGFLTTGPRGKSLGSFVFFFQLKYRQLIWASLVAQTVKTTPAMQENWVQSLGWEDSREEGLVTLSSILAYRIPKDRGAWWATVHGIEESDTTV